MKKTYKVLLIPSSDDEDKFEDVTEFDEAVFKAKKEETMFYLKEFKTKAEADAYSLGYTQGVGYLGNGLFYQNY